MYSSTSLDLDDSSSSSSSSEEDENPVERVLNGIKNESIKMSEMRMADVTTNI